MSDITCGGCHSELYKLKDTHPQKHGFVGRVCLNCGRVYISLNEYDYTIRADPDKSSGGKE